MKLILDTHIWYWFVIGDETLSKKTIENINQAALNDSLYLSAISVWEVAMLENKNRIHFKIPTLQWVEQALKEIPIQLLPLTPAIAVESCHLEDFHGDPADRIIVATARVENLTLLTRDKKIQYYGDQRKAEIVLA
jgi:PIN domain nuclease of toxin-antitoxin system